ncbi:MAG: DUF3604 domain-containing protein [Pseudomonadota bacterium]
MTPRQLFIGLCAVFLTPAIQANPTQVYFGDLHLHTRYSNDAFAFFGTSRTPDDAYRYARGKSITTNDGRSIRLSAPLDFMAVTEHMRYPGALWHIAQPESPYHNTDIGRMITSNNVGDRFGAFFEVLKPARFTHEEAIEGLDVPERSESTWQLLINAADDHYKPGRFTTFAAYEWTAEVQRLPSRPVGNMHRVVLFEDTKDLPYPFSSIDSIHPERLWDYLEFHRARGVDAIAIPHNTNISDGLMFAPLDSWGKPITEHYAARRTWNEPLVEVTQQKGTPETHPALSPNDDFADFELRRELFGSQQEGRLVGSYVRDAYQRGLEFEAWGFFNPFQFGLIGATDYHRALSAPSENRVNEDPEPAAARAIRPGSSMGGSAGGLTAIWATDNNRQALFDAMRRREAYATTGPRISVRLFAGWQYDEHVMEQKHWVDVAYERGVPMGGSLVRTRETGPDAAPILLISAAMDPNGGALDRIQVIKGSIDNGQSIERIYNVALSGDRKLNADGSAEPVGNSVDLDNATWSNDIGASTLSVRWRDPDFDPESPAFYYVRVLEIPTPRWQVYDAIAVGRPIPEGPPTTIQERAFTSPIWYEVNRPRHP